MGQAGDFGMHRPTRTQNLDRIEGGAGQTDVDGRVRANPGPQILGQQTAEPFGLGHRELRGGQVLAGAEFQGQ